MNTFRRVRDSAPMLIAHHVEPNMSSRGSYNFAAITDAATPEDLQAYSALPAARLAHKELAKFTVAFDVLDINIDDRTDVDE